MAARAVPVDLAALDALIDGYTAILTSLVAQRAAITDRRPAHGTQGAYLLSLMALTVLPVTPQVLVQFAASQGVRLERRSVCSALLVLQRRGEVASVGRGRWRRDGPPA